MDQHRQKVVISIVNASFILFLTLILSTNVFASGCMPPAKNACPDRKCPRNCNQDVCCARMGGVSYCDSSAGRLVCKNGEYSTCYCTRHAVMDLQRLHGCCFWQGGVLSVDMRSSAVICNNGSVSEMCTLQNMLGGYN